MGPQFIIVYLSLVVEAASALTPAATNREVTEKERDPAVRELAHHLRALAALAEDLCSVPSTRTVAHNHL